MQVFPASLSERTAQTRVSRLYPQGLVYAPCGIDYACAKNDSCYDVLHNHVVNIALSLCKRQLKLCQKISFIPLKLVDKDFFYIFAPLFH